MKLPQGHLGYAIGLERPYLLDSRGEDSRTLMARYRDQFPTIDTRSDPLSVLRVLDQGQQGSCQGHALAQVFTICMFLATGRIVDFSRAAGYYLSQRHDGISGDNGSTLSGGNWVATVHGMCEETAWPYPSQYNPREPHGVEYPWKLAVSKPFTRIDDMREWLALGLPIQTGIRWPEAMNQEVVTTWSQGGGGHSTCLWLAIGDNVRNVNSWGKRWNGDGCHSWTWRAIELMLRDRWSNFVGYAPDRMLFPPQDPV